MCIYRHVFPHVSVVWHVFTRFSLPDSVAADVEVEKDQDEGASQAETPAEVRVCAAQLMAGVSAFAIIAELIQLLHYNFLKKGRGYGCRVWRIARKYTVHLLPFEILSTRGVVVDPAPPLSTPLLRV